MFLIKSLQGAVDELCYVYTTRVSRALPPDDSGELRGPVGLFFVRPDGTTGSRLSEEMAESFEYWHVRTGQYFDGVFLGWGWDGVPAFDAAAFSRCADELADIASWHYGGSPHLLLTEYVYRVADQTGSFDFDRMVATNISGALIEDEATWLSPLIERLRRSEKDLRTESAEVSVLDYQALLNRRWRDWNEIAKEFERFQPVTIERQLQVARENLLLIEERMDEYVLPVDVPLQLKKSKGETEERIAELEERLARRPSV